MEENLIRLILWLVFIAVWVISGLAKKKRDDRRVASGEAPDAEELREYFGEDEPDEPPHESQEDEFRKFLRTIAGVEEEKPETPREPSPGPYAARSRIEKPGPEAPPPAREIQEPAVSMGFTPDEPRGEPRTVRNHALDWDRKKLRSAVIYSEILGPPRALRPYRAVKRDSFRF